ncbi:hypothetical protein [Candidatus Tisiphia endosymbiont of Hybos culiciformis]|uniref:hypothetical protein n=1 Tax=Candidatus Tisiphia endosymbiont of Hybos culiciformis TaxID=3139331 RepID=UPI003CCAE33D
MIKNITIVSCHSREGGNLDTCFRRYDTKFVSPNSIGFTIVVVAIHKGNQRWIASSTYGLLAMTLTTYNF